MRLRELVAAALGHTLDDDGPVVTAIAQDHRKVVPGAVFVARSGGRVDGHRYTRLAVEAGAVAVVGERAEVDILPWRRTPYLKVADARGAVAKLAATFHGHPSRALVTVGVTGTDGKTTTSFLLHHLLAGEHACGLLSTAGILAGRRPLATEGHFTTPEATEVQSTLAAFRAAGCSHAVVEASSHGFGLRRLDEVDFALGVWTNLSPEHLDFHGTLANYLDAKLELARRSGRMVLNRDDPYYPAFAASAREAIGYGLAETAEWRAEGIEEEPGGLAFEVLHDGRRLPARLPMVGGYNVHNALAALAAAAALGLEPEALVARLASFGGVPGRMQVVQSEPFAVVVDFAHTGPALEKALAALRPGVSGRLLLVVGAAGERDPGKRGPIGRAAASGADLTLFTEEDSRSEATEEILQALAAAAQGAGAVEGRDFRLVPDRREAVAEAIAGARPGDLVLLAGKGHERTLEREHETLDWDEVAEARRHLG